MFTSTSDAIATMYIYLLLVLSIFGGAALREWQKDHPALEEGTTVSKWPTDAELIHQARQLLLGPSSRRW